jgi:hypothetical protein
MVECQGMFVKANMAFSLLIDTSRAIAYIRKKFSSAEPEMGAASE